MCQALCRVQEVDAKHGREGLCPCPFLPEQKQMLNTSMNKQSFFLFFPKCVKYCQRKSLHAGVTRGEYYLQRVLVCVTPPTLWRPSGFSQSTWIEVGVWEPRRTASGGMTGVYQRHLRKKRVHGAPTGRELGGAEV